MTTVHHSLQEATSAADRDASPPPEMHDALALVQRIGGRELLDKVVSLFRTSAEERLVKLRLFIEAGDATQVSRLAHAMKGSAAQVGAESLRAMAAALEKESGQLDRAALFARLDGFADEVRLALAQLESYRSAAGGGA
jgi:HPt (histidine-containing phosphotransfer) domain-containing protein